MRTNFGMMVYCTNGASEFWAEGLLRTNGEGIMGQKWCKCHQPYLDFKPNLSHHHQVTIIPLKIGCKAWIITDL